MTPAMRILIIGDQPCTRHSLRALIVSGWHPEIVGGAAYGLEVLAQLKQLSRRYANRRANVGSDTLR